MPGCRPRRCRGWRVSCWRPASCSGWRRLLSSSCRCAWPRGRGGDHGLVPRHRGRRVLDGLRRAAEAEPRHHPDLAHRGLRGVRAGQLRAADLRAEEARGGTGIRRVDRDRGRGHRGDRDGGPRRVGVDPEAGVTGAQPGRRDAAMIVPPDAAATGLSDLAVQTRVDAGQVNTVLPAPGRSLGQILRANVLTRFNAILGSLFVVVLVVGPPQDALFGAVLVVNTGIGVAQELRAKRALDRLAILTAGRARAVRNGAVTEIALDRIVLDDVLELARGDQVPVDGTVLCDDGLELDEALLTGEAEPVRKDPGDAVMSGSFVVAGTGRIRAAGVGADAYAARLQAQARRFSLIRS